MTKVASSANPSVPLHEVLEAEFAVLHGELPPDYPSSTEPNTRLKAIWTAVHALPEKRAALCISGGGIRSATFGLGVLQGLAGCGLLDKFHYLSTVSGGGYIGSWLSAWINREGLTSVTTQLAHQSEYAKPNPESIEIQNLRFFVNYLYPKIGLLSVDTWRLFATYVRNITAMSVVLIPLLAAVLAIPRLYLSILTSNRIAHASIPPRYASVLLWLGLLNVIIGLAYVGSDLPSGGNKRFGQRRFLIFCLVPLLVAAFSITTYWAWFVAYGRTMPEWSFLGITPPHGVVAFIYLGVLMHLVSWLTSLLRAHGFRLREFIAVMASGAIVGWLIWLAAARIFPEPLAMPELYSVFAAPLFLAIFFLHMVVFAIVTSPWTANEDREWWSRAAAWILSVSTAWIGIALLTLFGPLLLDRMIILGMSTVTVGGVIGFVILLAGRLGLGVATVKPDDRIAGFIALIFNKTIAAYLFGIALIIFTVRAFAWSTKAIAEQLPLGGHLTQALNLYVSFWGIALLALGLAFFGIAMAYVINPNQFSLQAAYRDRLIRAYLGASNSNRRENPFTGFDENDNIKMRDLWLQEKFHGKLMPVVNIALNLVSGEKLGWQERKAESFTVSPLHCGSSAMQPGYRSTTGADGTVYGGPQGISLGRAMALSGAAASPNMGYYTSPLVRLVFTLLNVRLGEWLGNPGAAGDRTFYRGYPNFSVGPIIADAFGIISDTSAYVNLSDGRHFESLGLYEMVLRRCHYIVVCDGSRDPDYSFESLGGAVRKIRVDLGIPIELEEINIFPRATAVEDQCVLKALGFSEQKKKGRNWAIGRIRYSTVDGGRAPDGVLIYIKPAWYGDGPPDLIEYSRRNKAFPHEAESARSPADVQFESYRMLGAYTVEKLCTDCDGDFRSFVNAIFGSHLQSEVPMWLKELIQPAPDASDAAGAV